MNHFKDFDFTNFWNDCSYALDEYIDETPSEATIALVEQKLGYKLPASYIALAKLHNGGLPTRTCYPVSTPNSWSTNHVALTGILSIGEKKIYSLCGELGSQFMIEEWGYPDDGIYFGDCPSAGHDMILLDYSACGPEGEPTVVHVDQESDYEKTFVAENFETFVCGLVDAEEFEDVEY